MVILYIYSTCWRMKSVFYECQYLSKPSCPLRTIVLRIVSTLTLKSSHKTTTLWKPHWAHPSMKNSALTFHVRMH
jgi:hypothetical protein